jgi:hypothetical protein
MAFSRTTLCALLLALLSVSARADDILFIGNSFTIGVSAPAVKNNGGVPKLFEAIATAKGRKVNANAVMAGGKDWAYHLAQPVTNQVLQSKTWTWVVLQDASTRPTHVGDVPAFMKDGETFSDRIAAKSPHAGILLFETWARPPGSFYTGKTVGGFSSPDQMMSELHYAYGHLRDDLAAKNSGRPVQVALVGTAFAKVAADYPEINLNAADHHHASPDGYYLVALVIYEAIYHDSVKGAPTHFYHDALIIPDADAAKLQAIADEVSGAAAK